MRRLPQHFRPQHHRLQSHNGLPLLWALGAHSVSLPMNNRYRLSCDLEQRFTTAFAVWILNYSPTNTPEVSPGFS
jgi:hypothetical protein